MRRKNAIEIISYSSPCGVIFLGAFETRLCLCDWQCPSLQTSAIQATFTEKESRKDKFLRLHQKLQNELTAEFIPGNPPVLQEACVQLDAYFQRRLSTFHIPLHPIGTKFQRQVWEILTEIPYGQTLTYADIARHINCPQATRSVANAIGANPLSIFIPCHRVISSSGALGGYRGGTTAKHLLLTLEKSLSYPY